MVKSYLSQQIKLLTLTTTDLFTDEEQEIYSKIIAKITEINQATGNKAAQTEVEALIKEKKDLQEQLNAEIMKHENTPRLVRIKSVMDTRQNPEEKVIQWDKLRPTRRICEFCSEESRAMGLKPNEITFDKIILQWRSLDVLRQVTLNGFWMTYADPQTGEVKDVHYSVVTASAGQLRRDKVQCMSDEMWHKIKNQLECGLSWDKINEHGGINVAKLLAYTALSSGATEVWDIDIDRCIVVNDFTGPVTAEMQYINTDYTFERGVRTVEIKHTDGWGMVRPDICRFSKMVRAPWLKGLVTPFDYMRFCREHNCEAKLTDVWGKVHDLEAEDIQVIFTASQLKMWKYYANWDEYKAAFKANGCHVCHTNYEESYISDTEINYQMLETLVDFPDDDLRSFCSKAHRRIKRIASDKDAMLAALRADEDSDVPWKQCLNLYPELLRDSYARETIKAIKKRWLLDAKSGRIKCKNKRLFAIPDAYAVCENWFLKDPTPKGLLENGEVACKVWRGHGEVDCLRSPHLYMEHAVRTVCERDSVYDWFFTNGIYTSCHDPVSRILQFDNDGDQLNVVADPIIVRIAKENAEKHDIVPLFYEAGTAPAEIVSRQTMFEALKRAHDYSGIGQVSNSLCRLWNRPNPDYDAAAWLCYFNNLVIDAAKTGKINSYENYPEVAERIAKATGGKTGKMPWFFQFSKNGRKTALPKSKQKTVAKTNKSTMNRLCAMFEDIGNINMNFAGIPPFNWQMLLSKEPKVCNYTIVETFISMDDDNMAANIMSGQMDDMHEKEAAAGWGILAECIVKELTDKFGPLENSYPSIVQYLFSRPGIDSPSHKRMFWRVFGRIAEANIRKNISECAICEKCGAKVPAWASDKHDCEMNKKGFIRCIDCGAWVERTGPKQSRCADCQAKYHQININRLHRRKYKSKSTKKSKEGS